jgi:hypothetical protein
MTEVARLRAASPLAERHQLLVGQRLDGWPEVDVLDEHGVTVRAEVVRFTVDGDAASFDGGVSVDAESNNRGRAFAAGLTGHRPGAARVLVTVPTSPEVPALRYSLAVAGPGTSEDA